MSSKLNDYRIPAYVDKTRGAELLSRWKTRPVKDHVFVLSSGTTNSGKLKSYSISRDVVEMSARAVINRLNFTSKDRWLRVLPREHVGGLAIESRCCLAKGQLIEFNRSWNSVEVMKTLLNESVSFVSLVPYQLKSLAQFLAPPSLRVALIGGDFLPEDLKTQALKNGWPLWGTYGMTETFSQVATSKLSICHDGSLELLSPFHVKSEIGGLNLYSTCFATEQYVYGQSEFRVSPIRSKSRFSLQDRLDIHGRFIRPRGRKDDLAKIKGRLIDLQDLNLHLRQTCKNITNSNIQDSIHYRFHEQVVELVYEKQLRKFVGLNLKKLKLPWMSDDCFRLVEVERIERTSLGKVKRSFKA